MRKLSYLLILSTFFLAESHNANAGKKHSREFTDKKSSHLCHAMTNLSVSQQNDGQWQPSAPFKPAMRKIWEKKAKNNPDKYRIIGETLWIKKVNN